MTINTVEITVTVARSVSVLKKTTNRFALPVLSSRYDSLSKNHKSRETFRINYFNSKQLISNIHKIMVQIEKLYTWFEQIVYPYNLSVNMPN